MKFTESSNLLKFRDNAALILYKRSHRMKQDPGWKVDKQREEYNESQFCFMLVKSKRIITFQIMERDIDNDEITTTCKNENSISPYTAN